MKAYKIWHDKAHYIAKGSNADNIKWTTEQSEALEEKKSFFFDVLGLDYNQSRANSYKFE